MPEKLAIGIDFGGTKILAGVVNVDTGRLIGTGKKKTRQLSEQNDVIGRIVSVVDEAIAESGVDRKKLIGIGIGAAGMVNRQKGILLNAANLGLQELPLTQPLSDHFGLPCRLGNDVEVATLGEMHFGAGRHCSNFMCIFVGTGIGGGIVFDGKQYRGASGTAGEIGHLILEPDGRLCGCGGRGCLEAYASRTAVAKEVLADLHRGMNSMVRDKVDMSKGILRSKTLAAAVQANDEVVVRAVNSAANYMAVGLASAVNLINPSRVIFGGGLIEAVSTYLDVVVRETHYRGLPLATKKLEIVKAELGDYAGIIGAAILGAGKAE